MDYPKSVPGVGLVDGRFVNEDPIAGRAGSLIPAEWGNAITDEMLAVIGSADLQPNESDNGQLLKAINGLIERGGSGRLIGIQTFSAVGTATYTPTPGTKFVTVRLIGGGAGGAGAAATSASQFAVGGGGGGGAYSEGRFTIAQIGASQVVTIGAGGAGGNVGNGGPGGTSSFGLLMTCPGGSAGTSQVTTASNTEFGRGAGGVAGSGGLHNLPGIQGQYGTAIGTTGHGGSGGGSAMFGGTGGGLSPAVNNAAGAATAPGAGGSGATNTPSNVAQIGGPGMPGALEIREYS